MNILLDILSYINISARRVSVKHYYLYPGTCKPVVAGSNPAGGFTCPLALSLSEEILVRPALPLVVLGGALSEVVIRVPRGIDAGKIRRRIEAILDLVVSDEFDKFIEYLEEYGLLRLQEESLREFLEDEPDVYTEEDIKR